MPSSPVPSDGNPRRPLDGVAAPTVSAATPLTEPGSPEVKKWKGLLLIILGGVYLLYIAWSLVLLSLVPSSNPALKMLPMLSLLVALAAGVGFLGIGALMLQRISLSHTDQRSRLLALIKVVVAVVPGLLMSVATPLLALREPTIPMQIISPTTPQELVAPLAVTFSVAAALDALAADGFVPVQYRWDINNDRKNDQETTVPQLTVDFDTKGTHVVVVQLVNAAGDVKTSTRRFLIRDSVFKITPSLPIVNQAAAFSLAHLYAPEGEVREVQWDFNEDGIADQTSSSLDVVHTFFKTGAVTVRALVSLTNNTQTVLERSVTVIDPPALPFPVTLTTQPNSLIGAVPFSVLFVVDTDEPVGRIEWTFGDGDTAEGSRVAHTFDRKGVFPVNVRVSSQSGVVASLQSTVNIVDELRLQDLSFEGTPAVTGGRITGQVPLSLSLTPRTATQFVDFSWEAPGATEVGSTETTLQAIYRREGTYTVTLIAQDLEDHVLRMPITVTVQPPESLLEIAMEPETGVAPLTVKFDASESFIPGETISGFEWSFGDGSSEEFGGASIEHTFTEQGTFTITLTARTTTGETFTTNKTLVVREPLLRACITPSRIRGTAPLGVDFSSACTVGNPAYLLWDFGDGTQSDQRNVIHVFEEPGIYTVTLTVGDGEASHVTSVTISAQP